MSRQSLAFGIVAAWAAFGLASDVQAQTYPAPGCAPYGVSYGNPIYPWGNYAGYGPYVSGYGTAGYGYGYAAWTGPAPKYRADAYTSWELNQYGLPPHPSYYCPSAPKLVSPNSYASTPTYYP